ncbi:MAG: tyrosine-type recombinase/integrase [Halobacteriovoraceae bacterium]|nr:tyrosine-type recombinase/integrase [Halobacteriovoraceae bacterium]
MNLTKKIYSPISLSRIEELKINELEFEFFQNFDSPHTRLAYRNDIAQYAQFVKQNFKNILSIEQSQKIHIVAFKDWLKNNDYTPKSTTRKISSISAFFNFLCEKSVMNINPCLHIRRPKQEVCKETNDLSDEEVLRLFESVDTDGSLLHRCVIYLLFSTGIRKSELINLKIKDFKTIRDDQYIIQVIGKGGKILQKLVPDETVDLLFEYLHQLKASNHEVHLEDWLLRPSKNPNEKYKNNTDALNRPLRPSSIDYIVKKYVLKAGITKHITAHSARATYIGSAIENGVDLLRVSQDVGHSSVKTTELYNKRRLKISQSPVHSLGFLKK